jgi:hypothetical protein
MSSGTFIIMIQGYNGRSLAHLRQTKNQIVGLKPSGLYSSQLKKNSHCLASDNSCNLITMCSKQFFPVSFSALGVSALLSTQSEGTLFLLDNFNAPDTNNLDLSDQTGRRSGVASFVQVRSSRIQHGIARNQLNFLDNRTGRIRFHDDSDNDNTTGGPWYDWATGVTGAEILSNGNLRVEFDWLAGNDTSNNWISVNMGISGPGEPEPAFRVNNGATDIGMLFRFNGQTELFDNGTNLGAQGTFSPTVGLRRITLDYDFDSFADGTNVALTASVDGTEVYSGNPFTWDGNANSLYFEIGTLENTALDNVQISSIPEPSASLLALFGGLGLLRRRR